MDVALLGQARSSLLTSTSRLPVSAKPSVPRSWSSVVIATAQPLPISSRTFSTGTSTFSKKISLKSASPVMCRSGRTSTPGECMSTTMYVRPACRCDSGSERVTRMHQSAMCAYDDQTFCPLTTKWPFAQLRARPHGGEIGAGARLREALAPDLLGREDVREVALLLLLGAVGDDRRPGHAQPDHAQVPGSLGPRPLLVAGSPGASTRRPRRRTPSARSGRRSPRRRSCGSRPSSTPCQGGRRVPGCARPARHGPRRGRRPRRACRAAAC